MSVAEAARALGIGRGTAYEAVRRYEASGGTEGLPVLRIGSRLRVPTQSIWDLVGLQPETAETTTTSPAPRQPRQRRISRRPTDTD